MLTPLDYTTAAALLDVEVNVIKAVDKVESGGAGFLSTGEIKILFEPHRFWINLKLAKLSPASYASNKAYADILYEQWGSHPYGKYTEQWERLTRAAAINKEAAYKSASYGRYQCMGEYHKECGFDTVFAMIEQYKKSEGEHLMAFVRMIKARKLEACLRAKNWKEYARHYNGSGYRQGTPIISDDYDFKLAIAYKSLS